MRTLSRESTWPNTEGTPGAVWFFTTTSTERIWAHQIDAFGVLSGQKSSIDIETLDPRVLNPIGQVDIIWTTRARVVKGFCITGFLFVFLLSILGIKLQASHMLSKVLYHWGLLHFMVYKEKPWIHSDNQNEKKSVKSFFTEEWQLINVERCSGSCHFVVTVNNWSSKETGIVMQMDYKFEANLGNLVRSCLTYKKDARTMEFRARESDMPMFLKYQCTELMHQSQSQPSSTAPTLCSCQCFTWFQI